MRLSIISGITSIILSTLTLTGSTLAQPTDEGVLLQTDGVLEDGDATLASDSSLYDEYILEEQAGQAVIITVESNEFDTYLLLLDNNGVTLAENNDWNGRTNSTIGYILPTTGTYKVWVNAIDASEHGSYKVSISTTVINDPVVLEFRADELMQQGIDQFQVSRFRDALQSWQSALKLYREIGHRAGEGRALGNLGVAYENLGEYQRAINLYEQLLVIARETGDRPGEGSAFGNLGNVYNRSGQYQRAINFYEQDLAISRELGDRAGEGRALGNLGIAFDKLNQYQRAINFYEQQLIVTREIEDRFGESIALGNLGTTYNQLGQYQHATNLYEQQLMIAHEIGDRAGEGRALGSLGLIYDSLGQYQRAINFYEQQLKITREIGDRPGEGNALSSLGSVYYDLEQYQSAINFYEQQLKITREIGDRPGEGIALGNLGLVYFNLGQYQQAIDFYEEDLSISREINSRVGESNTLGNIGFLFEVQEKPELAISFYKQSINTAKQISQLLNEPVLRQSYLEEIKNTYYRLANLLLLQERHLEAQQVLELFKRQELSDYINDEQILAKLPNLTLLPNEVAVIDTYNILLTASQQLNICTTDGCPNINDLQTSRDRASQRHQSAIEQLNVFIQESGHKENPQLRNNFFLTEAKAVIAQQPDTVLIYPLVLDKTLWLLWVTENGMSSQQVASVNQHTLTETINAFRKSLEERSDLTELQTRANQLYNWLIAPIENALNNSIDPSHLVLALDRNTRYIPIAALYDGQQYLIEKYDISTILAASLTNTEERVPIGTNNVSVLAAGVSENFGDFAALPYVPIELDNIVKELNNSNDQVGIYSGRQLLDPDFTAQKLRDSLSDITRFLHIATHGEFVSGNRYSSYLLMGNGEKLPLPEIANLGPALRGIHLAVLSACQTALGGPDEEGLEIAGLGYYFFKSEVDAVMASLWNVNDASTSQLMQAFYQTLSEGTETTPVTKARALRTAQLALLNSNTPDNSDTERFTFRPKNPEDQPRPESGFAHPYYWAPFILIGNGL